MRHSIRLHRVGIVVAVVLPEVLAALESARWGALDGRLLLVYEEGVLVFEPVVAE